MAPWFWDLPWEKPEDFWLNVLAGLPFFIFDIVIITTLLPSLIQWREERSWRETRLEAARYLFGRYATLDRMDLFGVPLDDPASALKTVTDLAKTMDTEIQTLLPVMGPEMSRDFLNYQIGLKKIEDDVLLFCSKFHVEGLEDYHDQSLRHRMIMGSADAIYSRIATISLQFHLLRIKYGDKWTIREAQRNGPSHLSNLYSQAVSVFVRYLPPMHQVWWLQMMSGDLRFLNRALVNASGMGRQTSIARKSLIRSLFGLDKSAPLDTAAMERARQKREELTALYAEAEGFTNYHMSTVTPWRPVYPPREIVE